MRALVVLLATAILSACAVGGGGLKPTIMTSPTNYLDTFPVGKVTEAEIVAQVGPPDRTTEIGGKKALVYELGEGYGKRTYSYIIDKGMVVDVLYNDQGPYNSSTATARQTRR